MKPEKVSKVEKTAKVEKMVKIKANPKVYFDITIGGEAAGRIVMEVHIMRSPFCRMLRQKAF